MTHIHNKALVETKIIQNFNFKFHNKAKQQSIRLDPTM